VEFYNVQKDKLQLDTSKTQLDPDWQAYSLEALYHQLCQPSHKNLSLALNGFLAALKVQQNFASRWAEVMYQAGNDANITEVSSWGERLSKGLQAYSEKRCSDVPAMFTALLENSEIEDQWRSTSLTWRGETYCLMKRYTEALEDLNKAIKVDPEYDWAIARRGDILRVLGNYTNALEDLNHAIELNPREIWFFAARGETYRSMGNNVKALEDFNYAIDKNPKFAWGIAARGNYYILLKQFHKGLADLNRAIELDSKDTWFFTRRGEAHHLMGNNLDASEDFKRAIEIDAENGFAISKRDEIQRLIYT